MKLLRRFFILLTAITLLTLVLCACSSSSDGSALYDEDSYSGEEADYDDSYEYDPSDIWQVDLAGDYCNVKVDGGDLNVRNPDDYEELENIAYNSIIDYYQNGTDVFADDMWHYEIRDDYTGYLLYGNGSGDQYQLDINRDDQTIRWIAADGDVKNEFELKYCEEVNQWYLQENDYNEGPYYIFIKK